MRKSQVAFACVGVVLALGATHAGAQEIPGPPANGSFIRDDAAIIASDRLPQLEAFVRAIKKENDLQLAVLTLPTAQLTSGPSTSRLARPRELATRTLDAWGLGRSSVLILITLEPRAIYVQSGAATKPLLDEATATAIARETIAPLAHAGDFGGAIQAGFNEVVTRITGNPPAALAPITSGTTPTSATPAEDMGPGMVLLGLCCWSPVPLTGLGLAWLIWRRFQTATYVIPRDWPNDQPPSSSGPTNSGGGGASF